MSDQASKQPEAATEHPRTTLRPAEAVGLLVILGLLIAAWFGTFERIWVQWFPGWWMRDLPLMERLTTGESYYTHGPLVPLISLGVAIYIYSRVGVPIERTRRSTRLGWCVLVFFLLTHLLFTYASVTFASGFALIGVIAGLVWVMGGRPLVKAYALPIALLVFMIPLPLTWIDGINYELKHFATQVALWLATHVFQVPALQDGSFVRLAPDANGVPKTLVIENVCGGLRSIIALTYFAALFAALCRMSGAWRWFLLVLAFPVAIACNVARITSLIVAAHYLGTEAAGEHGWFHDLSGIMVFALALGFMFLIESLVLLAGRVLKRNWTDVRLLGYLNAIKGRADQHLAPWRVGVLVALVFASVLSFYWNTRPEPKPMGEVAGQVLPKQVELNHVTFDSSELTLSDNVLAILETNDYCYRRYTSQPPAPPMSFDLLIVFSQNNRRGTHSPELCIQGNGERILSKNTVPIELSSQGHDPLDMREVVSQDNRKHVYYLYVFKSGDHYTTNYTWQQATILLEGLVNRHASGALIRLTVPVEGDDIDSARRLAKQAAEQLLPTIDKKLP